jgi:hypothetical protein
VGMLRRVQLLAVIWLSVLALACNREPDGRDLPDVVPPARASSLDIQPVPTTLEEAVQTLTRGVSSETFVYFRRSREEDIADARLGEWLAHRWGLTAGGPLADDLARRGMRTTDEMTAAVLTSFWRRLHGQPLDLRSQVDRALAARAAARRASAEAAAHAADQLAEQNERFEARMRQMMLQLELVPRRVPRLSLGTRQQDGLDARYLTRFRGGVLVGVRDGPVTDRTRLKPYYLHPSARTLRPVRIAELEDIGSFVHLGDDLWVVGSSGIRITLIRIGAERAAVPLPRDGGMPQLGIDGAHLLAVYADAIYRRHDSAWTLVHEGPKLPRSGPPPRREGSRVYFRDEGRHESEKRLWWLELTDLPTLVSHDAAASAGGPRPPTRSRRTATCGSPPAPHVCRGA